MDYIPSEMLRGNLDTIILLSLSDSDKHSNQIKDFVEARSGGKFILKQGTFYSCLQRIVKQGYVTEYRTTDEDGVRRKFFQLTEKGKSYIDENINSWSFSKQVIDMMISSEDGAVADEPAVHAAAADEAPYVVEPIKDAPVEEKESDKLEDFLKERTSAEPEPIAKEKEIASIDYTQAETFFSNEAQEKAYKKDDFEQLSFDSRPVEEPVDTKPEPIVREEIVEEKIVAEKPQEKRAEPIAAEVKKEAPAPIRPTVTKEDSDDFGASDSNVDYRTVLEGIFPSSKPGYKRDSREMTYEEGVNVEEFFKDDDKKSAAKKTPSAKKQTKVIKPEPEKRAKPVEAAPDKSSSFYDFSDIQNLADEEGFKIRVSSNENKKDIGRILINKLNFYSSLIIFGIFFLEAILLFAITGPVADLNFVPYLIFIGLCAIFPLVNGIIYFISPDKKTRQIAPFKSSIELIIIICLNLLLIDVVCCVLTSMDFSSYKELIRYLFYPIVIIATIPFYVVFRYLLLEKNKFFE